MAKSRRARRVIVRRARRKDADLKGVARASVVRKHVVNAVPAIVVLVTEALAVRKGAALVIVAPEDSKDEDRAIVAPVTEGPAAPKDVALVIVGREDRDSRVRRRVDRAAPVIVALEVLAARVARRLVVLGLVPVAPASWSA